MKKEIYILIADTKKALFAFVLALSLGTAYSQTYTIVYTGSVQTINLTTVGNYEIECWGADGGDITGGPGGGGKGGYAKGVYNVVTPGTVFNVLVGGKGMSANGNSSPSGSGGWNGGGGGGYCGKSAGGGGGATDVRVGGTAAINRVIVAGGGGGAAYYNFMAVGGNGGGQIAQNGDVISSTNVITPGGGGAGANAGSPGLSPNGFVTTNGTATGGGGGGNSPTGFGQPGTGGGPGGAGGTTAGGSTGGSGGGGGGYAGGAGGTQTLNVGAGGGGGSSYVGGVNNGTTTMYLQPGFVFNPDVNGNGYVIIRYICDVDVQASKNPICIGEQVTLSTNAGSNIQWSHGPTTPSVIVTPTSNTSYTLIGVSSTTTGCTNTVITTVSVNPLPVIAAAPFPTVLCQGMTGTITASGAVSYSWSPGTTSGNVLIVNPTSSTIYTVSGQSAHGCYNTSTVAMNVNTNQLTMSPDTAVCQGSPAFLRANGAVNYNWTMGAPFQTVTVYPVTSTVYSVNAIDIHNCPLSGIVSVTVNPRPTVNASSSHTTICRGETLQLFANGATSYQWSNGESTSTFTQVPKFDLPLSFSVTGTNDKGCKGTASITVLVSACVSINEEQAPMFKLMPNPASTEVTIESPIDATYLIYDLAGRILLEGRLQAGSETLNLNTLSSGLYLVRLQTLNSERTVRLIKN